MTTLQIIYALIGLAIIIWTPKLVATLYAKYSARKRSKDIQKFVDSLFDADSHSK